MIFQPPPTNEADYSPLGWCYSILDPLPLAYGIFQHLRGFLANGFRSLRSRIHVPPSQIVCPHPFGGTGSDSPVSRGRFQSVRDVQTKGTHPTPRRSSTQTCNLPSATNVGSCSPMTASHKLVKSGPRRAPIIAIGERLDVQNKQSERTTDE